MKSDEHFSTPSPPRIFRAMHQHPLFDKSSREICFEPQSEILCSPSSQNNGHSMFLALFAVFGGITTGRAGISGKIVHVLKVRWKVW